MSESGVIDLEKKKHNQINEQKTFAPGIPRDIILNQPPGITSSLMVAFQTLAKGEGQESISAPGLSEPAGKGKQLPSSPIYYHQRNSKAEIRTKNAQKALAAPAPGRR